VCWLAKPVTLDGVLVPRESPGGFHELLPSLIIPGEFNEAEKPRAKRVRRRL
jgi:hypothetical protein